MSKTKVETISAKETLQELADANGTTYSEALDAAVMALIASKAKVMRSLAGTCGCGNCGKGKMDFADVLGGAVTAKGNNPKPNLVDLVLVSMDVPPEIFNGHDFMHMLNGE